MFFDQIVKPCSASVCSAADPVEIIARWEVPMTHQKQEVSLATSFGALLEKSPLHLPKARRTSVTAGS